MVKHFWIYNGSKIPNQSIFNKKLKWQLTLHPKGVSSGTVLEELELVKYKFDVDFITGNQLRILYYYFSEKLYTRNQLLFKNKNFCRPWTQIRKYYWQWDVSYPTLKICTIHINCILIANYWQAESTWLQADLWRTRMSADLWRTRMSADLYSSRMSADLWRTRMSADPRSTSMSTDPISRVETGSGRIRSFSVTRIRILCPQTDPCKSIFCDILYFVKYSFGKIILWSLILKCNWM